MFTATPRIQTGLLSVSYVDVVHHCIPTHIMVCLDNSHQYLGQVIGSSVSRGAGEHLGNTPMGVTRTNGTLVKILYYGLLA